MTITRNQTREQRIAARLAELTATRAAIPEDGAVPSHTTRDQLVAIQARRRTADQQLTTLHKAVAAVETLGSAEADERWRGELVAWRATLHRELMKLKPTIRTAPALGRAQNLEVSMDCIDIGLVAFTDSGRGLEGSALGELMATAGYAPVGADPAANFVGVMPWFGGLPEVEQRITSLAAERERAEAHLEAALMTDEQREQQAARQQVLNDLYNRMDVRVGPDPRAPGLVAYRHNDPWPVEEMTADEREAVEQQDGRFRADQARRRQASLAAVER